MPPSQGAALPPPQGPRPRADEGHCRGDPGDRTQEPRASAGREGRVEKGWGGRGPLCAEQCQDLFLGVTRTHHYTKPRGVLQATMPALSRKRVERPFDCHCRAGALHQAGSGYQAHSWHVTCLPRGLLPRDVRERPAPASGELFVARR